MVTRRDMGVSFAPAKRAAVWQRPRREPGRWPARAPLTLDEGRRTEDLPLLALTACLSTLEIKPCTRSIGSGTCREDVSTSISSLVFAVSLNKKTRNECQMSLKCKLKHIFIQLT